MSNPTDDSGWTGDGSSPGAGGPAAGTTGAAPGSFFLINYSFTFVPQNADGDGERGDEGREERPVNGFVIYGVPPVFDQSVWNAMGVAAEFAFGVPQQRAKRHATKAAIEALKKIPVETLPEDDRKCSICFDEYTPLPAAAEDRPEGAAEPAADAVPAAEPAEPAAAAGAAATDAEAAAEPAEPTAAAPTAAHSTEPVDHSPLEMPCGHVFGADCLRLWLRSSVTCPLCRTAVEDEQTPAPAPAPASAPAAAANDADTPADEPAAAPAPTPAHSFFLSPVFRIFSRRNNDDSAASTPAAGTPAEPREPRDDDHQDQTHFTFHLSSRLPRLVPRPSGAPAPPPSATEPATGTPYATRHHPYSRASSAAPASSTSSMLQRPAPSPRDEMLAAVLERTDMHCASAAVGLCDTTDPSSLLRLECGHSYHEDCLRTAMTAHGDAHIPNLRDIDNAGPRAQRDIWCMRCRRYRPVDC
ncbi:uncharacterized protein V1510DRAFT_428261 [Dipodascopsis tothii]|uniref:uncharacterized protein n=1 Tax=Dipodascopsis tothii TaxID=44089 RepID=UPI0034CFFFF7